MRPATARVSPPVTGQLELRGTSSRLVALLRERQKLLAYVTRKKGRLEKLIATLDAQHAQMAQTASALQPLIAQGQKIDREIHGLFAALLAKPSLPRKDRRLIQALYEMLQQQGILSLTPASDDDSDDDTDEFDDVFGKPAGFADGEFPPSPDPTGESPSAKRFAGSTATAIRDLFRRLATAIHPDKVQDADSREQRTEAMKEVTRAYQDGDLARLLELEKVWLAGEDPAPGNDEDETERRCSSLEQTNRELKRQLKELDAKMREVKRSAPAEFAAFLGLGCKHGNAPLGGIVSTVEHEVAALREARDFVQSFVDGKITFAQFVAGPASGQPEDPDWEPETKSIDDFLADILLPSGFGAPGPRNPPRRRRR